MGGLGVDLRIAEGGHHNPRDWRPPVLIRSHDRYQLAPTPLLSLYRLEHQDSVHVLYVEKFGLVLP